MRTFTCAVISIHKKKLPSLEVLTAMRWLSFPIDTGGLNARGVAYRGKALAIDAEE